MNLAFSAPQLEHLELGCSCLSCSFILLYLSLSLYLFISLYLSSSETSSTVAELARIGPSFCRRDEEALCCQGKFLVIVAMVNPLEIMAADGF